MPGNPPRISVILPFFNEEAGVKQMLTALLLTLDGLEVPFEVVCVDDGSSDTTLDVLNVYGQGDARIVVRALSRNFGKEAAVAAGLALATGDSVVVMDSDLQHPPEVIAEMLALWERGFDVVHGVKRRRGRETFTYRKMAECFNFLMGGASGMKFHGSSDFKLLDRQVVDALNTLPEKNRFFRGLVSWLGFRSVDLEFDVKNRTVGESKWSNSQLFKYSLRNLLAFSSFPLKAVAFTGFSSLVFSGLLSIWTLYRYIRGDALSGFTTVILLQLMIGSLLLAGTGVIALYLSEMFRELKGRPTYAARGTQRSTRADAVELPRPQSRQ